MKIKKKKIEELKPGQKFRYKRKLYLRDELECGVHLFTGKILPLSEDDLVTPVKVKINEVEN